MCRPRLGCGCKRDRWVGSKSARVVHRRSNERIRLDVLGLRSPTLDVCGPRFRTRSVPAAIRLELFRNWCNRWDNQWSRAAAAFVLAAGVSPRSGAINSRGAGFSRRHSSSIPSPYFLICPGTAVLITKPLGSRLHRNPSATSFVSHRLAV